MKEDRVQGVRIEYQEYSPRLPENYNTINNMATFLKFTQHTTTRATFVATTAVGDSWAAKRFPHLRPGP